MMNNTEETRLFKAPIPIIVRVERGIADTTEMRFVDDFQIGRDATCDFIIKDRPVSRFHLSFYFDGEGWWVKDLMSSNGTFVDGERIGEMILPEKVQITLGESGPLISVTQDFPKPAVVATKQDEPAREESMTQVMSHYFSQSSDEPAGAHTMMVRRAFDQVKKKQSKRYLAVITMIAILLVGLGGFAWFQQQRLKNLEGIAEEIFYAMKSIEIQMGQVESVVLSNADPAQKEAMLKKRAEFKQMAEQYNSYIAELGIYNDKDISPEEKVIMRVARIFGESELNIPEGFVAEVQNYIGKWKTTNRLTKAIKRAENKGYTDLIRQTLLAHELPSQFFYLALQESDFNLRVVGPKTRWGIAKGIWQFIPDTAYRYGLKSGPLLEERHYDPKDERFHFRKATLAASRYLKDIYNGRAQASGLLVLASYNWGHNRVKRLIQGMPENPRDRNFWRLLEHYKIPKETYDYVFYIFSAAVIGEDPALFGFDFKNPLTVSN